MTDAAIPRIDCAALMAGDPCQRAEIRRGAMEIGFLTLVNTPIPADSVRALIDAYRVFFALPESQKSAVDMARTGAVRGWGGPQSEQVDPKANPDYKEVFDMGFEVPGSALAVHAPNQWPEGLTGFRETIEGYYSDARALSLTLLGAIAEVIGQDAGFFNDKFAQPMALLRGNYYPPRPDWAGARDFGIGAHTDYGCLTLLATDGVAGLEALTRGGDWVPVRAAPGEFVINFGEMLEMWTDDLVRATPHRVIGTTQERLSVPLFFNPGPDTNVAPIGSGRVIRAVDHLQRRYDETYVHLKKAE